LLVIQDVQKYHFKQFKLELPQNFCSKCCRNYSIKILFYPYFCKKSQMQIQLLLFGIVADLIGKNSLSYDLPEKTTVSKFKEALTETYPQLQSYNSYAVAVNEAYANDTLVLNNNDILAIIPPVSGG